MSPNFNRTFELSEGTYFKWVAHDDWHARQSLSTSVELLDQDPRASLCATGVAIVDERGEQFARGYLPWIFELHTA